MNLKIIAAGALLPLLSSTAWAEPASPLVQAFAQDASLSNQFEVSESRIALEKSADPHVRAYAQHMIHDHTMAQAKLHAAAQPSQVVTGFMFDPTMQGMVEALSAKSGPEFDAAYWADQREAHASAEAKLSDYATNGEDPMLRRYAAMTLPVVLMHARMIPASEGM